MSDLYGSNESEDMSSFLQILLQISSSSAVTNDSTTASVAAGGLLSGGGAVAQSSTSFNFSDPSCFFAGESGLIDPSSRVENCEGPEACDVPSNPARPRSLKRSRAAEFHNLSEKRRRSRINEKLKALQNLIPNSNKTDKASMLDEAIEYLKQLQLQVQMLIMRNGLRLHPGYSVGSLQSTLAPSGWLDLDANRGTNTLSGDQNVNMQSVFEPTNHNTPTLPMLIPSTRNTNNNSGILPTIDGKSIFAGMISIAVGYKSLVEYFFAGHFFVGIKKKNGFGRGR